MAQQVIHARVSLPNSGTFNDMSTNGFTFEATGSDVDLTLSDIDTWLENFYNTANAGQTHPLAYYLSDQISRASNGISVLYYDVTAHLDGTPAGSPIGTFNFTLGTSEGTGVLPAELALCIGYRGNYGTDPERGIAVTLPSTDQAIDQGAPSTHTGNERPRARDRGRIYLGPLDLNCLGTTDGSITSICATDVGHLVNDLANTQLPGDHDQFNWVQWSRRAASVKQITYYYVDDYFATQRRRADTSIVRTHTWVSV